METASKSWQWDRPSSARPRWKTMTIILIIWDLGMRRRDAEMLKMTMIMMIWNKTEVKHRVLSSSMNIGTDRCS